MKIQKKFLTPMLLTLGCAFSMYAQNPIPMGPGPVISISPAPSQSSATTPQQNNPLPQGPGPVISVSPAPSQDNVPAAPTNPIPQGPGPAIAVSPAPNNAPQTPPPGWGSAGTLVIPPNADWMNQGTMNVMATGYDSEGVMKQIPLFISYNYNGVQYDITVLNAWNPYTLQWNANVDQPAYSTSYFINGFTYNYYTVLSTGTYYFNL